MLSSLFRRGCWSALAAAFCLALTVQGVSAEAGPAGGGAATPVALTDGSMPTLVAATGKTAGKSNCAPAKAAVPGSRQLASNARCTLKCRNRMDSCMAYCRDSACRSRCRSRFQTCLLGCTR